MVDWDDGAYDPRTNVLSRALKVRIVDGEI